MRTKRPLRTGVLGLALTLALIGTSCQPPPGTQPIASPPAPQGCVTDVGPADKIVVTGCGGDITYNVSVPSQCIEFACGLIFDVHGWTMSGDIQERNTGIARRGREAGFIVVQPNAPGSPPSWSSSHYPFVADFMDLAIQVWRVDPNRVHFTGFSQGGAMTFWMRCNRADVIASAAPVALGGAACSGNPRPVRTLYIQGNNDIFVSEASKNSTIQSFVTKHALGPGTVLSSTPSRTLTLYVNASGFPFASIIHNDTSNGVLGHCIMGSDLPTDAYGCDQPADPTHGDAVIDFFLGSPME